MFCQSKLKFFTNNFTFYIKYLINFRKTPSPAEFFGYVFYFAGIIVGPAFFYRDYIEFITGENMKYKSITKVRKYRLFGFTKQQHE